MIKNKLHHFSIILFNILLVLFFTNCNKNSELNDSKIIGNWKTISSEHEPTKFIKFNSDHSFKSYELSSGRKYDESVGSWQLTKEEKLFYLYLSGHQIEGRRREWNEQVFVELVEDTLIFSSIKSGKRGTAWIKSN